MKFDAFSAGITPGGLRSKNDIKLLICYILSRFTRERKTIRQNRTNQIEEMWRRKHEGRRGDA